VRTRALTQHVQGAQAVYEHITGRGVNPAEELILYGQSVGTGPSCYLAAHRPVRGLVLHSPMATGIRVISNSDSLCAPASMLSACDLVCGCALPGQQIMLLVSHT
jgi:dienelactone hydrolase